MFGWTCQFVLSPASMFGGLHNLDGVGIDGPGRGGDSGLAFLALTHVLLLLFVPPEVFFPPTQ